jgi:hypothetical protein
MKPPTPEEIDLVVNQLKIKNHRAARDEKLVFCPSCNKPKMHVSMTTGLFHCKRETTCGFQGNLWKLADFVGITVRDGKKSDRKASALIRPASKPDPKRQRFRKINLETINEKVDALWGDGDVSAEAMAWLRSRGFSDSTIRRFKLGLSRRAEKSEDAAICIPYLVKGGACMFKTRSWWKSKKGGEHLGRVPAGVESPFFNSLAVEGQADVLIVEGEWDVAAMYQMDWLACGCGSSGSGGWKDDWGVHFESAERIFVWYDKDKAGINGREKLVDLYGSRIHLVDTPLDVGFLDPKFPDALEGASPKDANDLLRLGVDPRKLREYILSSARVKNTNVVQVADWLVEARAFAAKREATDGDSIRIGFPKFDSMVGLLRPAEITVLTGAPGCGKTVLADWIGRMSARAGFGVVSSNLENSDAQQLERNEKAWQIGEGLSGSLEEVRGLPSWLTKGGITVDELFDSIRYAAKELGARLWVVDHVGWLARMICEEGGGVASFAELAFQIDRLMSRCTKLAEETGLHILLLAHSNEKDAEREGRLAAASELAGAAAIQRDAANILVMGRPPNSYTGGQKKYEVTVGGKKEKLGFGQVVLYGPKLRAGAQPAAIFNYEHTFVSFYEASAKVDDDDDEEEGFEYDW